MNEEERQTLYSNILAVLPKNDTKRPSLRLIDLNWKQVAFGRFSEEDCRNEWKFINACV